MAASTASPQTGRETIARAPETALIANGGEEDEMPAVEVVTPAPGKRSAVAPPPGETGPKPADPGVAREETDTRASSLLTCAVCGASFETRKGLSSHARSHLRQLGVVESESSGAPIDLLYELTRQRGALEGAFPSPAPSPSQPASARKPQPPRAAPTPPPKKEAPGKAGAPESEESEEKLGLLPAKAVPSSSSSSSSSTPSSSSSSSPVVAGVKARPTSPLLKKAPISSLLPASSPLRALDHERGAGRLVGSSSSTKPPPSSPNPPSSSSSSGALPPSSKPFWAPQDTDAPLNLTVDSESNKDIVCKLCGAWFETRKGLSSHARAHLRHFGVVDAETKGSPIDYLNELIKSDDFKHRADDAESSREAGGAASERPASSSALKRPGPSSSSVGAAAGLHKHPAQSQGTGGGGSSGSKSSGLLPLPPKRLKTTPSSERSAMQVYRLSGGELTPLSHGETVKEIGCEFCGEYFENRKGLSSHARSHLRQMGITEWSVNGSPIDTLREIIKRRGLPCALPLSSSPPPSLGPKRPLLPKSGSPSLGGERDAPRAPRSVSSPSSSPTSGLVKRLPFSLSHSHPPTARKVVSGGGLAAKLKPEPVHLELGVHSAGGSGVGGYQGDPLQGHRTWTGPDTLLPLNLAQDHEPTRDIRCEFCGEYFENRKGLSSHARSHLRQMGITEWSVNGSPIDTLREIMRKKGAASGGGGGGVVVKREPGVGGQAWDELAFPHPRPFRKSPLSLLHSGSRLLKPGLGSTLSLSSPTSSSSSSSLNGKAGFLSPSASVSQQLGKRAPQDEAGPAGGSSERHQPHKPFSPPSEFSFRGKTGASPDKHGMDASCELCGFYFENRKALASHARAHLRQFGVTEWCVNGSPIETLSAWMRSKPHKVAEMHRSYLQGGRPFSKKVRGGSLSSLEGSSLSSAAQRSLSSPRPSLGSPLGRRVGREVTGTWGASRGPERTADGVQGSPPGSQGEESGLHFLSQAQAPRQHGQVARSELNVRSPRGFERRPPKHQAHEGGEAQSRPPQPPRARTVPALVPKPPSTPLVKLVGNIYSLKCRFCEVEFQGPLSVQEDWVRHLQQHILDMNFSKPEPPAPTPEPPAEETPPAPAAQAL